MGSQPSQGDRKKRWDEEEGLRRKEIAEGQQIHIGKRKKNHTSLSNPPGAYRKLLLALYLPLKTKTIKMK